MRFRAISIVVALLAAVAALAGDDPRWPQFRGPGATGVAADGSPPIEWDVETGSNVLWKTPIPGLGHSSPVVWGDRIYVTSAVRSEGRDELKVGLYGDIAPVDEEVVHRLNVYAIDRATGRIVWERTAHEGVPETRRHTKSSHANPTPATDGEHVVAFFGSDGLYAYDRDGKLLWSKDFGLLSSAFYVVPAAQWGFGSSPVIHDGRVIVQVDVIKDSFLAAFDVKTGREMWRTPRDEVPTWSTPTVIEHGGRTQVVVNGYKHIGGYDFATGKQLWTMRGGGDIPAPTPFAAHGMAYITNAHGAMNPIYAVRLDASGDVTVEDDATRSEGVAWMHRRDGAYMPTPVVVGELLYVVRDNGVLGCYDARTGEEVYRERLGNGVAVTASSVAAGGRVYITGEQGDVFVVKAGRTFELLAHNRNGEITMASPAIAGDMLVYRTRGHLLALGEKPAVKSGSSNWPQWRGPLGSGEAPGSDPPVEWSEHRNVRWKVELPGSGLGTPIVWEDRVYLTAAVPTNERTDPETVEQVRERMPEWIREQATMPGNVLSFLVLALDRDDGDVVWQQEVRRAAPHEGTHPDATWASASMVTDGEVLIAHFGSFGTFALDLHGNVKWQRDLGDMTTRNGFGEGSSPALHGDAVVINWDHEGPSFITALDRHTGETRWRVDRDEVTSWATPIVVDADGGTQVVVPATGATRGYDLATGEALWQASGMTVNTIPSPVHDDGRVFVTSGFRGNMLQAIDVERARGDLTGTPAIAWTYEQDTPYVSSPLLYGGRLYFLKHLKSILSVVDATTGEKIYGPVRLEGLSGVYASPVAAAGRVYVVGRQGATVVLGHGAAEPEVLAVNKLDDEFDASPAIAGGELFLRGRNSLYCIAEKR